MTSVAPTVHIIGAGISGLVAAQVLESKGYAPTILDADEAAGGRVQTDVVEGYQLDRGFQVLLTGYPYAQKYLDFEGLDLQHFLPGATIFADGKQSTIGDPLREPSMLWGTLLARVGGLGDKLRILKLNRALKKSSLKEIFERPATTTLQYLQAYGFSKQMIQQFFKPFFSGIFLESDLATSSRMFEFVYKLFGEGYAALPKAGIGAISQQLQAKLKKTTFRWNTKVTQIEDGQIILDSGETLDSQAIIVATTAAKLLEGVENSSWQSCDNLYFETNKRPLKGAIIGLVADSSALINNIFYHTSLPMAAKADKELLSVTVVKSHELDKDDLVACVQKELQQYCGIRTGRFLKHYAIPRALPKRTPLYYEQPKGASQYSAGIFLAGDHLLNGSLNAAMVSGERAALDLIAEFS